MKCTAVFIDFSQFILGLMFVGLAIDSIIDIFATLLFSIWFSHHGTSLIKKSPLGFFGTIIGEFIPFVDMAPLWSFYVWRTIRTERKEAAKL